MFEINQLSNQLEIKSNQFKSKISQQYKLYMGLFVLKYVFSMFLFIDSIYRCNVSLSEVDSNVRNSIFH